MHVSYPIKYVHCICILYKNIIPKRFQRQLDTDLISRLGSFSTIICLSPFVIKLSILLIRRFGLRFVRTITSEL